MKQFGVLLVSSGKLAKYMAEVTRGIVGETPRLGATVLGPRDRWEKAVQKVRKAAKKLDGGEGILVLADVAGATPFNVAQSLKTEMNVEVIGGVNLPMVIKAVQVAHEMPLSDAVIYLERYGMDHITRGQPRRIASDHGG